MNCTCKKSFDESKRNKYLPENSPYKNTTHCLNCIIEILREEQKNLYPVITKTIQRHKKIKKAYFISANKLSIINKQFMKANYEQNIITHNISMEKKTIKTSTKKHKKTMVNEKTIHAMLANLPKDQQAAVMSNFLKTQIT